MAQLLQSATPGDHDAQLAALGLRLEYFRRAIEADESDRRRVTPNDPITAAGTNGYNARIRVLREVLISHERWERENLNGLELVVNPEHTIAIGVFTGDHTTGWPGNYHPRNQRPIGKGKIKLIAQNPVQRALFSMPSSPEQADLECHDLSDLETWFFITYRRHFRDGVVRVSSELSLPLEVSIDNYIEKYARRITFPNHEFGSVIPYIPDQDDGPSQYEVNIDER